MTTSLQETSPSPPAGVLGQAASPGLLLVALLLVALNMRGPLAALSPVVVELSEALSLTPAQAGLLTSIPVLCFALFAPSSSSLVARVGPERALLLAIGGIVLGQVVRALGSLPTALGGMLILGAAVTVGNIAVPTLIARDFRSRAAGVTGAYSATMNLGATLTTVATAPMALWWGWQWALASWALMAALAFAVWSAVEVRSARNGSAASPPARNAGTPPSPAPWWQTGLLCFAFVAQAGSYFAMTAWLPEILLHRLDVTATGAGAIAAPFQFMAIAGSLGAPLLLRRGVHVKHVSLGVCALWLAMPVGLLLAPSAAVAWTAMAGAAQGANFTIIFTLVVQRTPSPMAARRTSTLVQTVGYAGAAATPALMGWAHATTGDWTVPISGVVVLLALMTATMAVATRLHVPTPKT